MEIRDKRFDEGKAFDWGKTSGDYAKYRDIYPEQFYQMMLNRGLCVEGQEVLDAGTGTGVLPRNMVRFGAHFTAADISENQIKQAKELSKGMDIRYLVSKTEELPLQKKSFDVITASQCYFYFDPDVVYKKFASLLKKDGRLVLLYMGWLPWEDEIILASEDLVLKYNPTWNAYGEKRMPIQIPDSAKMYFEVEEQVMYDVMIPFTRESWNGRMKASRGVGASLTKEEIDSWEKEHVRLLNSIAPESFELKHYVAMALLKIRS